MRLPELIAHEQIFPLRDVLPDPPSTLAAKLRASGLLDRLSEGARVAIGVGSRGIAGLPDLVEVLVREVRSCGAHPFIIPAMGSHGGATAQGQRTLLARLGVTEDACGAPLVSSMETVDLGRGTASGASFHVARTATEADCVILLNRVKAHTSYKGGLESGLTKMLVVGLGQEPGARSFHLHAQREAFPGILLELAHGLISRLKLLFGVAVLEDPLGRTLDLAVVPAAQFEQIDREFLARYELIAPRLPFLSADLLIVERIGKDISGTGMETNVIGRSRHPARQEPARPRISRIWARSLTEKSEGNATGIGLADFISKRLAGAADMDITVKNALNALAPERAFIPPSLSPERMLLGEALRCAGVADPQQASLAWINDTSDLASLLLSPALAANLDPACAVMRVGHPVEFAFDSGGDLLSFESHWDSTHR